VPVRLVAADLDGTLVRRDRTVSARTRAALQECRRRDIVVVVVTARRWHAAAPVVRGLELSGLAVAVGGGAVRDIASGRVVSGRLLPGGVVATAAAAVDAAGLQPMVAVEHGELHLAGDPRRDGPAAATYLARGRRLRVSRPVLLAPRPATRVLAMGGASRIAAAARACAGLRARITVQDCIVPRDPHGERAMELHVAAADKGSALRDLCVALHLTPGAVLAIGDAPSDVPMFAVAGTAVLMGQAEPGLRRHGAVLAPDVDADGAAWAIEQLVLA